MQETWVRVSGLGRSPGEGKGYPLQSSGLENSMDCIVHGVAKSQTQLSDFHFLAHLRSLSHDLVILALFQTYIIITFVLVIIDP